MYKGENYSMIYDLPKELFAHLKTFTDLELVHLNVKARACKDTQLVNQILKELGIRAKEKINKK